jgi:predicted O-methyltransferase YrrM
MRRTLDVVSATLDALIAENRELRRELRHHEERLRAMERSRWWRLHPRRLVPGGAARVDRRELPREQEPAAAAEPSPDPWATTLDDSILASFQDEVVERGAFTEDWVTSRFAPWEAILGELEPRQARLLEIGSYEGLSACYLLWRLPRATITCIDTWVGPAEHMGETGELEAIFDANVALVDASRVVKLVGDSKRRLVDLVSDESCFDLVYVDGSHLGLDVLVDAALSWQLLEPGGVIVFDDYEWAYLGEDALLRPGKAIDAFREIVEGKHELVLDGYQVGLRKVS